MSTLSVAQVLERLDKFEERIKAVLDRGPDIRGRSPGRPASRGFRDTNHKPVSHTSHMHNTPAIPDIPASQYP